MITTGFTYLSFLLLVAGIIVWLEKRYQDSKFFKYVPAVVLLYLVVMLLSTFGVWQKNDEIDMYYTKFKDNLLPAMIFLMLLRCDMRKIIKLGPKLLLGFFSATISIAIGFIVTYALFKNFYEPDTWKSFGALCGSWMGGTGNMVAIQGALSVPDIKLGYALLMDSVNYAIWVMVLLWLVPFARIFNRWTKSDTSALDEVGTQLANNKEKLRKNMDFSDLIILTGTSLFVSAISIFLGGKMPETDFLSVTTWTVIIATIAGIAGAVTPLAKLPGTSQLSNLMLFTIIGLIASRANFTELAQAPLYIISGFVILSIHAIVLLLIAKLFKLDLFTCGVASLANIGGTASAPILAGAYSEALIPIGILMALMGYIVGTGGGLIVAKIMSIL